MVLVQQQDFVPQNVRNLNHIFAKLRSKKEAYVKDFTVLYIVLCVLQTNQKGFQDLEADWAPWRADCLFIFI